MKKVISFDFWNTLVKNQKSYRTARAAYLQQYSDLSTDEIERIFEKHKADIDHEVEQTGVSYDTYDAYLLIFNDIFKSDIEYDIVEVVKDLNNIFLENCPNLFDETIKPTLENLSKTHRLVLISNTVLIKGVILREVMNRLGIKDYFEHLIFSDEMGVSKPSPVIYERLTTLLGNVPKSDITHIGDNEITDVQGSLDYGFNALLVNKNGITMSQVEKQIYELQH